MKYEYRRLKGRIVEVFGTQAAFAAAVGISKNTMSMKLTGKWSINQKDIELWAKLLQIERKDFGEYFFT